MAVLAIELNDAGIRAVKNTAPGMEAFPSSPGIAVWDGAALLTGREASRRARLKPRWSHDRFWQELDTSPLPAPFPSHFRRADLLHAHLEEIWNASNGNVDEVILAVPGSFSTEQLGLILGIARSCQMPISGLVDQGVAASLLAPGDNLIHLDIHLHRAVATQVRRGTALERTQILVDEETGLLGLFDAWVKYLAQIFVRTTRFDPLHRGESEQALYDRLPDWLDMLRQEKSAVLAMRGASKEYSVELTREQIVHAVRPFMERMARLARSSQKAGERAVLLLTPAVANLPGAADFLMDTEMEPFSLPAAAGAMGALKAKHAICSRSIQGGEAVPSEGLTFVTQLPLDGALSKDESDHRRWAPPALEREVTPPTHVLCDGVAHAITSRPMRLGLEVPVKERGIDLSTCSGSTAGVSRSHCTIFERNGRVVLEDHSSYGTFLNDRRVVGRATLAAGDRLRVGTPGIELRLIKVESSHDTTPRD